MKCTHTLLAIVIVWFFSACGQDVVLTDIESSEINGLDNESSISADIKNQEPRMTSQNDEVVSSSQETNVDGIESSESIMSSRVDDLQSSSEKVSSQITISSEVTVSSSSEKAIELYDYQKIEAENGTVAAGDVDMAGGGGWFIRTFNDGDIVKYSDVDFGPNGAASIIINRAQAPDFIGATIDLIADSKDGVPFAVIDIETTQGWDDFQPQTVSVTTPVGTKDLYVVAHHDKGAGDFDWLQFSSKEIKAPKLPENLTLTADETTIIAVWDDKANDEISYNIYINSSISKPRSPSVVLDADATTHSFENLLSGTTYYVWVEAKGEFLTGDAVTVDITTDGEPPEYSCLDLSHCADKNRGEWTLVVIPDTQHYSQNRSGAPIENMRIAFDWLVTIKDQLNIQFVQGLGDITEDWNQPWEWDNAMTAWDKLYDQIPFAVNQGNHDDPWMLNARFPLENFDFQPWWGGYYEGTFNTYQSFTFGNEDYIFMNVQSHDPWGNKYSSNPGPIDWANGVISANPDKKVILGTHDTWETKEIEYNLLNKHDNIVLSNAGHTCQNLERFETYGPNGGMSNNFIIDYQCAREVMFLRYYIFKPLENMVEFITYSPVVDEYESDGRAFGSFALEQNNP